MAHHTKMYSLLLFLFIVLKIQGSQEPFISQNQFFDSTDNNEHLTISSAINAETAEQIFDSSSQEIKNIVSHLKDPNFLKNNMYRYAIFVGEPGTGKTETAKAIAYKMEQYGWKTLYITSGDVVGDKRNQTTVRLRQELTSAQMQSKALIVIIDELNELLEHSENEHYDTSTTSKFLWGFLDSQRNNPNFFMIGTMNRDTKLPQPLKSRIIASRIEFHTQINPDVKRTILHSYLTSGGVRLENEVSSQFLDEIITKCTQCSFRDLEMIALKSRLIYLKHNYASNDIVLDKSHVEYALKEYHDAKIAMGYNDKEETEEERQERRFVQQVMIENLIRRCQETHYQYSGDHVKRTWQTMPEECIAELNGLLLDFQQSLARTFNNRSDEAKENKKHEINERLKLEYDESPWYQKIVTERPS